MVTPLSDEYLDRWLCDPSLRKDCPCQWLMKRFTCKIALSTTVFDIHEADAHLKKTIVKSMSYGST